MQILSLISFLLLFLPSAHSQATQPESDETKTAYFLIDASGSMKNNSFAADKKVQKIWKNHLNAHPESTQITHYFGANDGAACWEPINVTDSTKPEKLYEFTPLGAVLEAAIHHTGNQPADIYLISDGEQTEDCGVDICEVVKNYLPRADINVISVPIGATSSNRDKLGCIEARQASPLPASIPLLPPKIDILEDEQTIEPIDLIINGCRKFAEKWLWLFGFIFLAIEAFNIGRRNSNDSASWENDTKSAESYQKQIQAGDNEAEKKLTNLIAKRQKTVLPTAENDNSAHADDQATNKKIFQFEWKYTLGYFGILILVLLALLPDSIHTFNLAPYKSSAWQILDSDFATAFAVIWIALIVFAGSQIQRRQDAEHAFDIATDEAERAAKRLAMLHRNRQKKEKQNKLLETHKLYISQYRKIQNLNIKSALTTYFSGMNVDEKGNEAIDFIQEITQNLLLSRELTLQDPLEKIQSEHSRLENIHKNLTTFGITGSKISIENVLMFLAQNEQLSSQKSALQELSSSWKANPKDKNLEDLFDLYDKLKLLDQSNSA